MAEYEERKVREEDLKQELKIMEEALAETEDGRFVINQFYTNLPEQKDVAQWYAGFTPEGYNEWARAVNFTEPYHIIDQVTKKRELGGLSLNRNAVCLDVGSGTGIIGQAMQNAGYR